MELQILTRAIEKAIDKNDIDFLLDILLKYDESFDLVLEKICSNYSNLVFENKDLYFKGILDFLYSIIEFRKGNYNKARYFANLSYVKGFKNTANLVLILIDINETLKLNKELAKDKFISIVSKILDDIVLLEYALLKYYNSFDKFSLFNLIYTLKSIFPKSENLFILELYFLKEINNISYNEILKILLENINKFEKKEYILEIFIELFEEISSLDINDFHLASNEYYYEFQKLLNKYGIF